jgi:hypothetical protein
MELHSGPKMANGTCGKTIVAGTIDWGSTVPPLPICFHGMVTGAHITSKPIAAALE